MAIHTSVGDVTTDILSKEKPKHDRKKTGPLSNVLLLVCNKALKGDVPTAWKQVEIIPLPKKGNLSLLKNYRGISLTSVAAKIYN